MEHLARQSCRAEDCAQVPSSSIPKCNRNQGEFGRARLERRQIETRISSLEAEIRSEARNAWRQYETARAMLAYIEADMLKHAGQVLSAMGSAYQRGESSFVDFLDARRAYNGTTQSYIEARAEYARSLYLIDATIAGSAMTVWA